ncbi:MAG: transcriptional repressor NrdR [Clostridia bacterium]|nr:transcriptional repressor NrdR [Oscillospiraceae bacterium]MBQ6701482.1 transcriptional repressor NrdR [Clostridia bacterium]
MKCPVCGNINSKVIDSRPTDSEIRRRRECLSCGRRFTTYEIHEQVPIVVIKKDGSKQFFDRSKILKGLDKACYKRSMITLEDMERITTEIEVDLRNSFQTEVHTSEIGRRVLEKLRDIDVVSYVRYASVYRNFDDLDSFMRELKDIKKSSK